MPDPNRTGDPEPETRDAPRPPEPGTLTAGTGTHDRDPGTATSPPEGRTTPAEPFAAPPGFEITRELGSGGMGVVYEARQVKLNRLVALKVLRDTRAEAKDVLRFLSEAEAVAAVRHPHVVQVYEFGQDAGRPFMALELLTGGTLTDRLRAGRLEPRAAAELVAKLADAVQAAHELGIVHRDLKPGNVLFQGASGEGRGARTGEEAGDSSLATGPSPLAPLSPKVTDFGLAKRAGGVDLTRTQAVMGTPAYMAPEQARGDTKFVGPAADVWALGAILYECLTGRRAFDADDTWAILRKVTDEPPPRPRSHVPGLPRDLELIALKCLEKNPADRYPSAAALADDLQRFLDGRPVSVHPAGAVERSVKWVRRNPVIAGAVAAVSLALLVGSAVSLAFGLQARKRGEEVEQANRELSRTNDDLTKSRDEQAESARFVAKVALQLGRQAKDLERSYSELGRVNAEVTRRAAEAQENGYLSDVALAHQLWKANDLTGMRAALDRCPPGRRRWEWHYLDGLSRPARATYPLDSPPLALAYSPDGKSLAFATMSGGLTVIDTATGRARLAAQLNANAGRNRALAFRPDGKELAVASGDRLYLVDTTAAQWKAAEVPAPKKSDTPGLTGHPYLALGYAKDGRLLGATESRGRATGVLIRDTRAGETLATFDGPTIPKGMLVELAGAAFSPDGSRFAARFADSGIRVGGGKDESVKFEPFQPVVMVWEVESKKLLASVPGGSSLFGTVAFDPFGRGVGFGRRGSVGLLMPEVSASLSADLGGGHAGEVLAVAFDLRNLLVWSGGDDKFVRGHGWLNNEPREERFVLRGCPQGILRVAVSPDGKEVAAAAGDATAGGAVLRFDVERLALDSWRSPAPRDRISSVAALAPDGSRFAAADFSLDGGPEKGRFVVRDVAGRAEREVPPPALPMLAAFRAGGGVVISDRGRRLLVTDAVGKDGPVIPLPPDLGRSDMRLAVAPDGKTVVLADAVVEQELPKAGLPTRVRFQTWDATTGKPGITATADLADAVPPGLASASVAPTAAATDAEGKRVAASFLLVGEVAGRGRFVTRGAVVVWDLATGKEVFRQSRDEQFHTVAFDPRGRIVVGGGGPAGGAVLGWDAATGKEELALRGHTRPILALAFGPDGRLATGGLDRVVKVWDVASGREVLTLDGFAREVVRLAFTPDGRDLVAATGVDVLAATMTGGTPAEWAPAEVRTFRGPK